MLGEAEVASPVGDDNRHNQRQILKKSPVKLRTRFANDVKQ